MITEQQGRELAERVLALSKADSAEVGISVAEQSNLRFANNDPTTNGHIDSIGLSITSNFGSRSASVSLNRTDGEALEKAVRRSESMAKLAPENPEFMPPLGPQKYAVPNTWSEATAQAGMADLAAAVAPVLEASRAAGVKSAGFMERRVSASFSANSEGMFFHQPSTTVDFSMTSRIEEGRGSGWASTQVTSIADLDLVPVGARAIDKALASRNAKAAEPGRWPVILEAPAVRDMVSSLVYNLGRRGVDEGRSFLNGMGGIDALGEAVFGDHVTVSSDPLDPKIPGRVADWSGLPVTGETWIESGKLQRLTCGRYWAKKQGIEPQAHPTNLVIRGEGKTTAEMVRGIERGFLVTRLWYIRTVQPQTLLLTGLTRDGTFAIENGEIAGPVKNFRFNESPVNVLKNAVASGTPERVLGSEGATPTLAPAMLIDGFNLSSVSDAS